MAKYKTLKELFTAIANSLRSKTGSTGGIVADDFPSVIDSLSTGGITPTGTKTITSNGTFDVTSFASALVNVAGLNAKVYEITVGADKTSTVNLLKNDHLKALRDNPKAFVMMRNLNPQPSAAMIHFWLTTNFTMWYSASTAYNSFVARATASAVNLNPNINGLKGDNYNGHLNIDANGNLWAIPNATYPIKAGTYQIIAGTMEML